MVFALYVRPKLRNIVFLYNYYQKIESERSFMLWQVMKCSLSVVNLQIVSISHSLQYAEMKIKHLSASKVVSCCPGQIQLQMDNYFLCAHNYLPLQMACTVPVRWLHIREE